MSTEDADRYFSVGDECSGKGARAMHEGRTEEGRKLLLQAIDAYSASLDAAPEEDVLLAANLRLCIGARRMGLGEIEVALASTEEVIADLHALPDLTADGEGLDVLTQARLNRAECWIMKGDTVRAREEIADVLAAQPDHPYAVHLRGQV